MHSLGVKHITEEMFKLNTQTQSKESFSGCESFDQHGKMSHILNLEVKVASTKQVSEAGNHDMPQRALKENPRLGYSGFFNHLSFHNVSKA